MLNSPSANSAGVPIGGGELRGQVTSSLNRKCPPLFAIAEAAGWWEKFYLLLPTLRSNAAATGPPKPREVFRTVFTAIGVDV